MSRASGIGTAAKVLNRNRLAGIISREGESRFDDYDNFGRPKTQTQTIAKRTSGNMTSAPDDSVTYTVGYTYRMDGGIASITYGRRERSEIDS